MQRKSNIKLLVLMSVGVLTLCGLVGVRRYLRSLPPRGEPKIYTAVIGDPCLVSGETDFFIATSSLIVRGSFTGETDGPSLIYMGIPLVSEGLHVTEVYKGDCQPGDDIEFLRIGEKVSLYKMLQDAEKRGIEDTAHDQLDGFPRGLKSWDLKQDSIFILNATDKARYALPSNGEEYILFLTPFPNWDINCLGARTQKYCVRKINEEGQVLNPFTEEYETIDWEKAIKLTRKDVIGW